MKNIVSSKVHQPDPETKAEDAMGNTEELPEHEVNHAFDTVMKAEEIKKHPKMWPAVQKKMESHMGTIKKMKITSTDQLREIAKQKDKA